ncbi:DUF814 domain-containing protein [bacterium]|nr:DUF814 domain-containing protein [candidate division CSSED10-310 bacterium]
MIWDLLLLRRITRECSAMLGGRTIQAVRHLVDEWLALICEGRGPVLAIAPTPGAPMVRLQASSRGEEPRAAWLAAVAGGIIGRTIQSVDCIPAARSMQVRLSGDKDARLVVELDRRFPNVLLIEEGMITATRRSWRSARRAVRPGAVYETPAGDGLEPETAGAEAWRTALEDMVSGDRLEAAEALFRITSGCSRQLAAEMLFRLGLPVGTPLTGDLDWSRRLPAVTGELLAEAEAEDRANAKVRWYDPDRLDGDPAIAVISMHHLAGRPVEQYDSLSAALGALDKRRISGLRCDPRAEAEHLADRELRRLDRRIATLRRQLARCREHEAVRLRGELIYHNIHRLKRGQACFNAVNYRLDPPQTVEVTLDPILTPAQNADACFKLAGRLERGLPALEERLAHTGEQRAALFRRKELFAGAAPAELREFISRHQPERNRREGTATRLPYRRYVLTGGWEVLVGRGGRDNLQLLRAHARGDDLWLHVRGYSGSHVIIRNPHRRRLPPMPVIQRAAELAAHFSKAAKGDYLPVIYTFRKFVTPVKGAAPGAVKVQREEIVFVDPHPPAAAELPDDTAE